MVDYSFKRCISCKVMWPRPALSINGLCPDCYVGGGVSPKIEGRR